LPARTTSAILRTNESSVLRAGFIGCGALLVFGVLIDDTIISYILLTRFGSFQSPNSNLAAFDENISKSK
jgi:hypothetical protein